MKRLPLETVLTDEIGDRGYKLIGHLGEGGFGTAYRAIEVYDDGDELDDEEVCLKLSLEAEYWHGETYFMSLFRGVSHVVQIHSAFPTKVNLGARPRTAFAITMELFEWGTVVDEVGAGRTPWSEEQILRRVRLLLQPLNLLHSMGVAHRDITPMNVFIGNRKALKLRDFGISRARLNTAGVRADVLNPMYAPLDYGAWWRTADDVYQVGLLMAQLASPEPIDNSLTKWDVNQLTAKGKLREAIKAAISVKSRRPQTAAELAALL